MKSVSIDFKIKGIKVFATALVTIGLLLQGATQASPLLSEDKKTFTPQDIMDLKTITDIELSPNGNEAIYVTWDKNPDKNAFNFYLWHLNVKSGETRTFIKGEGISHSPKWSPDGQTIAFKKGQDLWTVSRRGLNPTQITKGQSIASFEWGPKGKKIGYLVSSTNPTTKGFEVLPSEKTKKIAIIDLQNMDQYFVTASPHYVRNFSWSPTAQEIVFASTQGDVDDGDLKSDIYSVNLTNLKVRPLVVRPGRDEHPKWSKDGESIAFITTNGEFGERADAAIAVVKRDGSNIHDISGGFDDRIYRILGWSTVKNEVYFTARHKVSFQLFSANAKTKRARMVTHGLAMNDLFSWSNAKANQMLFASSTPTSTRTIFVTPLSEYAPKKILDVNPHLAKFSFGKTEVISWKTYDGLTIEGLVAYPFDYDKNKRYPLMTIVHGGPAAGFGFGFMPQLSAADAPVALDLYPPQLLTTAGYVMFMPNIRNSVGYGKTLRQPKNPGWGKPDGPDVMAGIDYLIDQGIVDKNRLGISGWSYGGYMAAWLTSQTNRFKVASVGAGVSNLVSFYGTIHHPLDTQAYFGGPPSSKKGKDIYWDQSPIKYAYNFSTPTLIQHGINDTTVPLSQADELFRALQDKNVPVSYIRYPKTGHVLFDPKMIISAWKSHLDWYNKWLN